MIFANKLWAEDSEIKATVFYDCPRAALLAIFIFDKVSHTLGRNFAKFGQPRMYPTQDRKKEKGKLANKKMIINPNAQQRQQSFTKKNDGEVHKKRERERERICSSSRQWSFDTSPVPRTYTGEKRRGFNVGVPEEFLCHCLT